MTTGVSISALVPGVSLSERAPKIQVASAGNEDMVNPVNDAEGLKDSIKEKRATERAEKEVEGEEGEDNRTFTSENLDRIAERNLKMNARLSIDAAEEVDDFIYRFVDKSNGEVIRQYPADEILEREKALEETQARLLDEDA